MESENYVYKEGIDYFMLWERFTCSLNKSNYSKLHRCEFDI